jgi:hypothetical protein
MEENRFSELVELARSSKNRYELWAGIVASAKLATMAEVGVWRGEFAEVLLGRCASLERYFLVDPWRHLEDWNKPFNLDNRAFSKIFEEAMQRTAFATDRRVVLRGRTEAVVHEIPDESLDLAYIDGDHTLRGVTLDLTLLLPKIKPGGLLGGDDFVASPWQHGPGHEPTLVFPYAVYFAEAHRFPIAALPHGQFLIQKEKTNYHFEDLTGKCTELGLGALLSRPSANQGHSGFLRKTKRRLSRLAHRVRLAVSRPPDD